MTALQEVESATGYFGPASFGQERLHIMETLQPGRSAFAMSYALRLDGAVDVDLVRRAVEAIVARHDVLRSSFLAERDALQVFVRDVLPLDIPLLDFIDRGEAEQLDAVREELCRLTLAPFDLAQGPLLRFSLMRLDGLRHVLGMSVHHIVADGQSLALFRDELAAGFAAGSGAPTLPELPIQYVDFAEWERAEAARGQDAAAAFWTDQLGDAPSVLDLPNDFPRAAGEDADAAPSGATATRVLPHDAVERLLETARARRATPATAFLAILAVLIARWTHGDDIVVAMPVSKRSRPELAGLMGLLVDLVPLRVRIASGASYVALLDSVRDTVFGAMEHIALPFERIVELAQVERRADSQPFQQVLFGYEAAETEAVPSAGGAITVSDWLDLPEQDAKSELSFLVEKRDGQWHVAVRYARSLFAAATAARLLDWFATLCQSAAARSDGPVGELALAPEAETLALLHAINDTARELPEPSTLAGLFEARARATPTAPALTVFPEGGGATTLDYRTLNLRANRLAHYLAARRIGRGDSVALAMPAGADFIVAVLAIVKLGAAYVPLDPALPTVRHTAMLDTAGVRVVLVAGLELPRTVVDGRDVIDVARSHTAIARANPEDPAATARPGDAAYVMFTSGSTGQPKGVVVPQRAIVRLVCNSDFLQIGPSDSIGLASSVSFDAATLEIWGALLNGARLLQVPRDVLFSAVELAGFIEREGLSVLWVTKGLFDQLVRSDPAVFRGLRVLLTGGDAASADSFRQVLDASRGSGLALLNGYGPTENTTFSAVWAAEGADIPDPVPIGRPIANSRAYVLDDALRPTPPGLVGELYVAGLGLADGYIGRSDLTAERFLPDPYTDAPGGRMYATGDLARLRDDGAIEFLGRIDDQVKIRGFRIELGDIAAALARHPSVAASHIGVQEDAEVGKRLVAYVVPRANETLTGENVRDHLRGNLPDFMLPAAIVIVPALPLNANGKIDRRALARLEAASEETAAFAPPQGATEMALAEIFAEVLKLARAGRDDNFFHLGGDSILGIRVVARARDRGVPITPRMLFQHPTIAGMAAAVAPELARRSAAVGARALPLTAPQNRLARLALAAAEKGAGTIAAGTSWVAGWATLRQPIDGVAFGLALEELRQRHDALRLRLAGDATVRVLEEMDVPPPVPVSLHRLRPPPPNVTEEAAMEAAIGDLAARLSIHDGTVFRGALFEGPRGRQRLVVLVHRLVADEVSAAWLLDEVGQSIGAGLWGQELGPAPLLRGWIERVAAYAASADLAEQIAIWDDSARQTATFRTASSASPPAAAAPREAVQPLSRALVARLSSRALAARHLSSIEVALAALAAALEEMPGAQPGARLLIDVVTDGRLAGGDPAETTDMVGNLSRRFPVAIERGGDGGSHGRLARAKHALRGLPWGGLGFGLLNHDLGSLPHSSVVLVDGTASGPILADHEHFITAGVLGRPFVEDGDWIVLRLERNAAGLHLACIVRDACRPGQSGDGRIDPADLAARVAAWLDRLMAGEDAEPVYVPSDFPLADLRQETLQSLIRGADRVENIYPVTPMQESMLIHALTVPGTAIGFEQACHRIDGPLDVVAFQAAWQAALDRHSILRTAFVWEGLARPLQIVHERLRVAFRLDDWSDLTPEQQDVRREAMLADDRREGFRLDKAPLMRAAIVRLAPSSFIFVSSFHHILLDGWCLPQLEREVRLAYEAGVAGRPHALPPARPYADYVGWLRRRDQDEGPAYFQTLFADWPGPTPLPGSAPEPAPAKRSATEAARSVLVLTPEETHALSRFARTERVTLGVVLHAAWGLALMQAAGGRDVVFGTTVSGRPPELPGIEGMMGLFINNLPIRLKIEEGTDVGAMLGSLHAQLLELRQHEETSPLEIEACVPGTHFGRMFDTLLVVENVPSALHEWESSSTLRFTLLSSSLRTGYALTLVAVPGDGLRLSLVFDPDRFVAADAEALLAEMRRLLLAMTTGRDAPAAGLLRSRPPLAAMPIAIDRLPPDSSEDRVPPRSTVEVQVLQIVEEMLGLALPGVTHDLLACGMDSITVSKLAARLRQTFGAALPLTQIITHATVAELAKLVAEGNAAAAAWRPLVPLTRGDPATTFYCVHPIAGDVSVFLDLAREMAGTRRFVALQSPGLGLGDPGYDSVEALAALYVDTLLRDSPGPLTIGGYSFGGIVAFELARQLEARGIAPRGVVIIDTPAPTHAAPPDEDYSDAQWLLRMLRVRERFHSVDLALTLEDLQGAGTPGCYDLVVARLCEAGLLPEGADRDLLVRMTRLGQRHYAHYRQYRPDSVGAPLAVIRAATLDASEMDIDWAGRFGLDDLGWRTLTSGPVLTATTPGDHVTMMRPPAVAELAANLNRLLGSLP